MKIFFNDPPLHNRKTLDATEVTHLVDLRVRAIFFTFSDRLYSKRLDYKWALPSVRCNPIKSWNGLKTQRLSLLPPSELSGGNMSMIHLFSSIKWPYHNSLPTSIIKKRAVSLRKRTNTNNKCPCPIAWSTEPQVEVLIAKLYRKPTATDRFLRFDPDHPLTVKSFLIKYNTFPWNFCAKITHENSPSTIGRFLGTGKGKNPIISRGEVVYKIKCECGIGSLGQTGRSLNTGNVPKSKFDPTKTSKTWKKSRLLRFTPSELDTSWHLKTPNQWYPMQETHMNAS